MLFRKRCRHLCPPLTRPPSRIHTDKHTHSYNVHTRTNLFTKKEMHASYTVISTLPLNGLPCIYILYIYILLYIYHAIVLNRLSD